MIVWRLALAVLVVLVAAPVQATTYYVATTGNDGNSCAAAQNTVTPKLTLQGGVGCLAGGDTLVVKAGTYTNQRIFNPPPGTATQYTVIMGDQAGSRPIISPVGSSSGINRGFECSGSACHHIEFRYFEIINAYNWVKLSGSDTIGFPHHVTIADNVMHDSTNVGILGVSSGSGFLGGDHLITGNELYRAGALGTSTSVGFNTIYNPGNRSVVEYNVFHNSQHGIAIWGSGLTLENVTVRNNIFYDMARSNLDTWQTVKGKIIHVSTGGTGHQIYNNIMYRSCDTSQDNGIILHNYGGTITNVKIYNNTMYGFTGASSTAIWIGTPLTTPNTVQVWNNIVLNAGLGIRDFSTGALDARNNLTSGTASAIFTNSSTYDLTLKSGSAAINGGTSSTGFSFCGSAPDQGAFETLAVTAASIKGNTLDVTVCNAYPPIQPLGTWTPACTGSGCGTPVTAGMPAVVGGGLVRITVNGITGGSCAAGQTWTISASGSNSDSVLIGATANQSLHTVTNFPVDSSACDGTGGGGSPGGPVAEYRFESNLNDSSGNANHAIGSANISYAASKYGTGVQFTAGVNSYVDTGLLSGHNPSTDHLVVAFGIRITQLGVRRAVAGLSIGTNQRFYIRRNSTNVWDLATQAVTSLPGTEFPVVTGDTHVCVKFNPTTDTATLYINGQAGTISGVSVQNYTSFVFASTLRFGLPSGFETILSGNDVIDQAFVYTADVSCTDLYTAWEPTVTAATAVQKAHQWQGVYTLGGVAENRGSADAQRTVVRGGLAALMVQIDNTTGGTIVVQPRVRYNINGGEFINVVPDFPTADGISYYGTAASSILNSGLADGPITGALAHTDGITLTTSLAIPTITMANNSSYTLRGIYSINAAIGDVVCFKVYDQSGSVLASYTPGAGACLTVISPQASGAF